MALTSGQGGRTGRIRIGQFNRLVKILRKSKTTDSTGGFTESYHEKDESWARIRPLSAYQVASYGQVYGAVTHQVFLRDRDVDVRSDDRIRVSSSDKYGEPDWDVMAILDAVDGFTQLLCRQSITATPNTGA